MTRMHAAVAKARAVGSEGERALEFQLRAVDIEFVREYAFTPNRKFRADFLVGKLVNRALVGDLLVEIEGGAFAGSSRHRTGTGFTKDCEKASIAAVEGYRVVRCTTEQVLSGECIGWIREAIAEFPEKGLTL